MHAKRSSNKECRPNECKKYLVGNCEEEQSVDCNGKLKLRELCRLAGQERCRGELKRCREQRTLAGKLQFELLVGQREPLEEVLLRCFAPETSSSNKVWSRPGRGLLASFKGA